MKIKEVVLCTARLLAPQWILQQPGFAADLMVSKRVTLLPNIEEYFYVDSVERFKNSQSLSTLISYTLVATLSKHSVRISPKKIWSLKSLTSYPTSGNHRS